MKKRLLAFLVTVFTLICMALPAYAEEGAGTPPHHVGWTYSWYRYH